MNAARRKQIQTLKAELDAKLNELVSVRCGLEDIIGQIDALKDEETDYKDNMPESFQQGEKGERADAAIEALETAANSANDDILSNIEGAEGAFQDVIDSLEEACQ